MGSYNAAVVTTAGQALLTSVLGDQGTLTFSKFQTSSYQYAAGTDLSALTSLNNVEQEVSPNDAGVIDSTSLFAQATVSNAGLAAGYTAYTLGMFASDGVNEVLFAVATAVTPDVIPADSGGTPSTYTYKLILTVSSTSDITINVSTSTTAIDVSYNNTSSGLTATNVQEAIDEISGGPGGGLESSNTTTFTSNVITQTYVNGNVMTTTFNADGTITEVFTEDATGRVTTSTTTFNEDGSITVVTTES